MWICTEMFTVKFKLYKGDNFFTCCTKELNGASVFLRWKEYISIIYGGGVWGECGESDSVITGGENQ